MNKKNGENIIYMSSQTQKNARTILYAVAQTYVVERACD